MRGKKRFILPFLLFIGLMVVQVKMPDPGSGEGLSISLGRSARACGWNLGCWKNKVKQWANKAKNKLREVAHKARDLKNIKSKLQNAMRKLREFTKGGFKGLWKKFKTQIFDKVKNWVTSKIRAAKNTIKKKVKAFFSKIKAVVKKKFISLVVKPALTFAFNKILPLKGAGFIKAQRAIHQFIGRYGDLEAKAKALAALLRAAADKSKSVYESALKNYDRTFASWLEFSIKSVVHVLGEVAKAKAEIHVLARARGLLEKAFGWAEKLITPLKTALATAVGSIPIVGGLLAVAANVAVSQGWKKLASYATKWVLGHLRKLVYKVIDKIVAAVARKAGKLDRWLKPIFDIVGGSVARIRKYVTPLMVKYRRVRDRVVNLRTQLAKANAVER